MQGIFSIDRISKRFLYPYMWPTYKDIENSLKSCLRNVAAIFCNVTLSACVFLLTPGRVLGHAKSRVQKEGAA